MIFPHRYLDLDSSVVNIAYLTLAELKRNKLLTYHELQEKLTRRIGADVSETFPYALNFLYLLGKVNYYGGTLDAFEINENQQALLQQTV